MFLRMCTPSFAGTPATRTTTAGSCRGLCQCMAVFVLNALAGICPTGPAWVDEAIAADTAHQLAECSNRGFCNYKYGTCECMPGYEGAACDRSTLRDWILLRVSVTVQPEHWSHAAGLCIQSPCTNQRGPWVWRRTGSQLSFLFLYVCVDGCRESSDVSK